MIKELLIIIGVLLAFPAGYLLAYLCRDELVAGRIYFKLIAGICIVLIFVFLLLIDIKDKFVIVFSLIFIGIVSLISLNKSYDKKFVR